jgi:hypothetical protein
MYNVNKAQRRADATNQAGSDDDFVIQGAVGANVVPAPAGNHIAICRGMVAMGTIPVKNFTTKKDEMKPVVRLTWELVNTSHVFKEENGPEPFTISQDYTLSMNKKAKLRKHLESWSGANFTEDQAKKFNIAKVLDRACLVNVVHKPSQSNGNIYANIAAITPVPAGVTVPEPKSPILKFAWKHPSTKENFMAEEFGKLPKFLQEKIESSNEYKALGGDPAANTPFAAATVSGDSLPF